MPTVSLNRDWLFAELGREYTEEEFASLCFSYGLELDDVTTEAKEAEKQTGKSGDTSLSQQVLYKIEVPANRYDLLCLEGFITAIRVFLQKDEPPQYKTESPKLKMIVDPSVNDVRPVVVCAVLRGVKFNERTYDSFIQYQEKLHFNICRQRTLVSIGTHDLDTIHGPFVYKAADPASIRFAPLGHPGAEVNAVQLFEDIDADPLRKHLRPYLSIIRNRPKYPVIYDSNGIVLSLPPIINGEHSKITLETKNVLIEVTATDKTKAHIVLNAIACAFSRYSEHPFEVEQVVVEGPNGTTEITPNLEYPSISADISYINSYLGLNLSAIQTKDYLKRMLLSGTVSQDEKQIVCRIPPVRSDIFHAVDLVEDVGIAYGYNNLNIEPPKTRSNGTCQPLNKLTDLVRHMIAEAGYLECVTFGLVSRSENYFQLGKEDDHSAVVLSNPCSKEFEVCRTSLIPGLLKSLAANLSEPVPIQLFEVSDVILLDPDSEVGAKNRRKICALYCNSAKSGFEFIQGLLDRILQMLSVTPELLAAPDNKNVTYALKKTESPSFIPGRTANVHLSTGEIAGIIGTVHPNVLSNFQIRFPVSLFELDLELFL